MSVRRLAAVVLTGVGLLACARGGGSSAHGAAAGQIAWEHDLGAALDRAGSEHKVVLVDFYAEWCGWCKKLDETTYADPAVQSALRRVVAVKLDAERGGRQAAERYGVDGFPTVVFLDAKGSEVARIPGYLPPAEFLEELRDVLNKA